MILVTLPCHLLGGVVTRMLALVSLQSCRGLQASELKACIRISVNNASLLDRFSNSAQILHGLNVHCIAPGTEVIPQVISKF